MHVEDPIVAEYEPRAHAEHDEAAEHIIKKIPYKAYKEEIRIH
jgi:hypothetical protein